MKSANPFVIVENCKEVVEHYQKIFGGDIKVLNEHPGKVLHAELHIGDTLIHFSDSYGQEYTIGDNTKIILLFESEEEIRRVYDVLGENGKVTVELQDTFFGALHGQVFDKNNINWVMNYFKEQN
ncbi:glyoxalase/bleomycin resistance/extradiol dioxygenase family protein [Alkalihalobacillus sp. AL-G]|uniref:VOC family protein n=1 Tax=Alkalihalobacillus sp. AL-G TaxID=2926399 RepID=UPI00272D5164|nr:VOC family protein [Alkalihalobacillus sp. AL-G]WLD93317.1 VOC family protein [Alkalihalobacillus sp. AL-G]